MSCDDKTNNEKFADEEINHRLVGYFTAVLAVQSLVNGTPKYKCLNAICEWMRNIIKENQDTAQMKEAEDCHWRIFMQMIEKHK